MEIKSITPEEFMEALENLAKIKKEENSETSTKQDNSDSEASYVVKVAFENGGITTITMNHQTMLDLFKAIEEKKESFIALDIDDDTFFIACNKVLAVLTDAVLTDKDED